LSNTKITARTQGIDPALAEVAAVVVFFLLLVALPAGSYFYLHRSLVAQYEVLARQVQHDARVVRAHLCHLGYSRHLTGYRKHYSPSVNATQCSHSSGADDCTHRGRQQLGVVRVRAVAP